MSAPRTSARPAAPPRSSSGTRAGSPVRPVLSAREVQALREALARRQAAAGTSGRAAATRTAVPRTAASRAATTGRPATVRVPVRRTTAAAAGTRRAAVRRAPARAPRRRPAAPPRTGLGWSRRFSLVAGGTLALPLAASLLLTGPPAPDAGPPDPTSLALTAQSTLLQQVSRYRHLEQELDQRRAELQEARTAEQQARAAAEAEQRSIGAAAADLYRASPQARVPMLALDVHDPSATSDVLFQQTVAERSARTLTGRVVRAERSVADAESAARRVADAQAALDRVQRSADRVLAASRATAERLGPEVSGRLAALGAVPVDGPQQARNDQALNRWQAYLGELAAAGIELPAAADLRDPAAFPAGLSPALDAAGTPIPGVAWAVLGNRPVTVLPAETVTAVSSALSQLGKPYQAGGAGPDTYDCGGFASASWLMAGYAVPTAPQQQWTGGTAVPLAAVQVGDLVFAPDGRDVGIYLGNGEVVAASAATYRIGVRSMAAGSSAVRVPLGAPAQPNPELTAAVPQGPCGAPLPPAGKATPAWGGYANGSIPVSALCPIGVGAHVLRCDAAASYGELSAEYAATFGTPLCITDSYRSRGQQVVAFLSKPALAAVPGTSNHGWALAVDLCGGINSFGTPQWTWMAANATRFGFVQPDWAGPRGEKPEPWHWEYGYIS